MYNKCKAASILEFSLVFPLFFIAVLSVLQIILILLTDLGAHVVAIEASNALMGNAQPSSVAQSSILLMKSFAFGEPVTYDCSATAIGLHICLDLQVHLAMARVYGFIEPLLPLGWPAIPVDVRIIALRQVYLP